MTENNIEAAYRHDHPGDEDGALVAGWLAANREAKGLGGFATVSPEVEAAMRSVDLRAIDAWLDGVVA